MCAYMHVCTSTCGSLYACIHIQAEERLLATASTCLLLEHHHQQRQQQQQQGEDEEKKDKMDKQANKADRRQHFLDLALDIDLKKKEEEDKRRRMKAVVHTTVTSSARKNSLLGLACYLKYISLHTVRSNPV